MKKYDKKGEISSLFFKKGESLGEFENFVANLPSDIESICHAVQNLFIHQMWLEEYGLSEDCRHAQERELRTVEEYLRAARELSGKGLEEVRTDSERITCICRDFSVILTAFLRAKGIPARTRCGFATYFMAGKYMDHWVTEYWDDSVQKWKQADAQLDALQLGVLEIKFNPLDLPQGAFLTAKEVWEKIQEGVIDGEDCGILDYWGKSFAFGSVLHDFISMHFDIDLKPWDLRVAWNACYHHAEEEGPLLDLILKAMKFP